ncbi:MAG: hypothetical protein NC222_06975 [Staphylococcus sp.]|nr:hypothetical protein [Staphylococcus sp.]
MKKFDKEKAKEVIKKSFEIYNVSKDKNDIMKGIRNSFEHTNIANLSRNTNMQRNSLYRVFAKDGNPSLDRLLKMLNYFDLKISVE